MSHAGFHGDRVLWFWGVGWSVSQGLGQGECFVRDWGQVVACFMQAVVVVPADVGDDRELGVPPFPWTGWSCPALVESDYESLCRSKCSRRRRCRGRVESSRVWWTLQVHERLAIWRLVEGTRRSCGSARCGWSWRRARRIRGCRCIRRSCGSGRGSGSFRIRCEAGSGRIRSMPVSGRVRRRPSRSGCGSSSGKTAS